MRSGFCSPDLPWLDKKFVVPKTLTTKSGLSGPTDVIETEPLGFYPEWDARLLQIFKDGEPALIKTENLLGYGPLNNRAKLDLLKRLHGQWQKITPGGRVGTVDNSGTLACFARDKNGLGILTNEHIGGAVGRQILFRMITEYHSPRLVEPFMTFVRMNVSRISSTIGRAPTALMPHLQGWIPPLMRAKSIRASRLSILTIR